MNYAPTDALYGQQQLPFTNLESDWNDDVEVNDRFYRMYHAQELDPFQNFLHAAERSDYDWRADQ